MFGYIICVLKKLITSICMLLYFIILNFREYDVSLYDIIETLDAGDFDDILYER